MLRAVRICLSLQLALAIPAVADLVPSTVFIPYVPGQTTTEIQYSCKNIGPGLYAVTRITIKTTATHKVTVVTRNGQTIRYESDGTDTTTTLGKPYFAEACPKGTTANFQPGGLAPRSHPADASISPSATGQASQNVDLADFNGDGNLDSVSLNATGGRVQLLTGNGTVLSTKTFPVGFQPDANTSSAIAADFNGDGKVDLACDRGGNSGAGAAVYILLGNGDGTFGSPFSFSGGLNPESLAVADFNRDGKLDIAVANREFSLNLKTVSLVMGNGNGTFGSPVAYATGEDQNGYPISLLALDLNGDGAPDLAVSNAGNKTIAALVNSGGGTLGQPVLTALPLDPGYLAYADFNHDGKLDLATTSKNSNAAMTLLGNGNGTFQPPTAFVVLNYPQSIGVLPFGDGNTILVTADDLTGDQLYTVVSPNGFVNAPRFNFVGGHPTGIAAPDLNGDGQPDTVTIGAASDVLVQLSLGSGQYKASVGYAIPGANPQAVATGDVNGDGRADVITANAAGSVSVLLGNGDGTLKAATTTPAKPNAQSLATGDFNGDGKLDVVVAAYGSQSAGGDPGGVQVLLGKGDGTFQAPLTLTAGGLHAEAVAVADLNGDGKLDIASVMVGSYGQPATSAVFLGQGDGTFAGARTTLVKSSAGTQSSVAIGDLNGDGKPDLAIVSNFGQQVGILPGDGAGGFGEAAVTPTTDFGPVAVAIVDFNGDGKRDLVIAHCCGESDATLMPGNGDSTFQAEQHFVSGAEPTALAVMRFAGSPGPDLLMAQYGGTWLALYNATGGPPAVSAVSTGPAFGSGTTQTFTFQFSDSGGYQNLSVVDVLINSALDGRRACFVAFVPSGASSGSVYLVNDAGDAGGPYQGMLLPGDGSVSNSQCTITGAGSSVSGSGTTLTLTLAIAFKSGFAGNQVLYLSAGNKSQTNSGWQALGTWGVPGLPIAGPGVEGVSPARSGSLSQTYTLTFTDTNGWQDITVANLLINSAIDGRGACYLALVPASGSVFLVNDAGDAGGPYAGMVLPGNGTVSNSQCSVTGVGSSISGSGNTLTVKLAMTFSHSFAGNRLFFLAARSSTLNSNWQAVGSAAIP